MGVDMGVMDKIAEAIKDLPEPLAREVLDFAEYLKARTASQSGDGPPHASQPLTQLAGGLAQSDLFAGNPVDIQRKLRNEWS
jgi:Protein of unknown function (DUF2281)